MPPVRPRRNGAKRTLFFRLLKDFLGKFGFRRHRVQRDVVELDPLEDSPSDIVGFVSTEKGGFPITRE